MHQHTPAVAAAVVVIEVVIIVVKDGRTEKEEIWSITALGYSILISDMVQYIAAATKQRQQVPL